MSNIRWKEHGNRRVVILTKSDGTFIELTGISEDIKDGIIKDGSWINIHYNKKDIFLGKILWFRHRGEEEPTNIFCQRWIGSGWGDKHEITSSYFDNIYLSDEPDNLYSQF